VYIYNLEDLITQDVDKIYDKNMIKSIKMYKYLIYVQVVWDGYNWVTSGEIGIVD
jgi:hypothetical protein